MVRNSALARLYPLGVKAIYHATHRDLGSGGVCRVYHIHKDGWTKVHEGLDVNKLHWDFTDKKASKDKISEEFEKLSKRVMRVGDLLEIVEE